MKLEAARPRPLAASHREFGVEVYGPLFGAIGRLALPAPVRLSDFVNEREGFLRLTDVEFLTHGDTTRARELGNTTEYLINKSGIELICQPAEDVIERRSHLDEEYGKSLWQALSKTVAGQKLRSSCTEGASLRPDPYAPVHRQRVPSPRPRSGAGRGALVPCVEVHSCYKCLGSVHRRLQRTSRHRPQADAGESRPHPVCRAGRQSRLARSQRLTSHPPDVSLRQDQLWAARSLARKGALGWRSLSTPSNSCAASLIESS